MTSKYKLETLSTTIASGTTTDEINLNRRVLVGVYIPASVASTSMKISTASAAAGTFVAIQDGLAQYGAAGDVTFTIAASKYLSIPPAITAGVNYIKLVFGSSETAKAYTLVFREV